MSILKLSFAAVAATFIAGAAQAGTIIHDDLSEFSIIDISQGVTDTDGTVAAARSDFSNVFDGDTGTFFSFGLGGSVTLTIDPAQNSITESTVIEITNPGSQAYPEALQLFLGNDGGGFIEVGFFLNSDASAELGGPQGPRVIESGSGVASMAAEPYPGTEGGFFRIFDIIGSFNTIKFVDASGLSLLGVGQDPLDLGPPPSRADGFDIGELSVTSVPGPGTLMLLGAGLAGLGFVGRRRNAA